MRFRSVAAAAPVACRDAPVMSAATITNLDEIEALKGDWLRLESCQREPVFFQSHAWCQFITRTRHSIGGKSAPGPRVVVIRQGGEVIAIWPLAVRRSITGYFAQDLTEPFGQYSEILIEPSADIAAVSAAALGELRRWRIDGLLLRRVRAGSAVAALLQGKARTAGPIEYAPAIAMDRDGGAAAWHRGLSSKTRKNLRNLRNRLAREGSVSHAIVDQPEARAAAIASCFAGRTDWLEASGLSSSAFADPAFEAIVGGLARAERDAPPVLATRLRLASGGVGDGAEKDPPLHDLSLHWGFEHQGRYYAYMAWKNPAFDAFSPGRLHLETIVTALAERGNTQIDLLVPALPYKTSVATECVTVQALGLAFSVRGVLLIRGWHAHLRPAVRRAALDLPEGVRRPIVAAARGAGAVARRSMEIARRLRQWRDGPGSVPVPRSAEGATQGLGRV